ncbi:MAG: DUF4921 family protein [Actinobacteria bacterium]|nr:DUF4921 family protein [Actinomycetota bacterium]
MVDRRMYYYTMPDGTVKQINPFSGREVWCVPGRNNKPVVNRIPDSAKKLERRRPEGYCNFCEANHLNTPPEKARLVRGENGEGGGYEYLEHVPASRLNDAKVVFRRIPNLFEIVTFDYWSKNYDYRLSEKNERWKKEYLADPQGLAHVKNVIALKLKLSGWREEDIKKLSDDEVDALSNSFFGGGHELIVAGRHYRDDAEYDSDLYSSGDLTPDEHFAYLKFTIDAMLDIYANNRYVRYISVFQNWLARAGASFDHLHKQLITIDDWGFSISRELKLVRENPNIYNELAVNLAALHNLVFAENGNAVAFADIGHQFPTLAVFSKSAQGRPEELSEEELRDFSDLLHACHAATGSQISCNEEWYYTPRDSLVKMPWHVLIKWRINTPAGFEHATNIFINPMTPIQMRDTVVPRLYELRDQGRISNLAIAEECPLQLNCLRYSW